MSNYDAPQPLTYAQDYHKSQRSYNDDIAPSHSSHGAMTGAPCCPSSRLQTSHNHPQGTSEGITSESEEPVSAKRKSSSHDGEQQKKKRNRAVLSCVPCKARKVKCDRKLPCESCVRRGMTADCCWEDEARIIAPQPFATASEVQEMRMRLAKVEALLANIPASVLESLPKSVLPLQAASAETNVGEMQPEDHEGQEAAVGALEELALGERVAMGPVGATLTPSSEGNLGLCISQFALPSPAELSTTRAQSTIFIPATPKPNYPTAFMRETSSEAMLRLVLKALPAKSMVDLLWNFYYDEYSWSGECESKVVNQREYNEFWTFFESGGRIEEIDPAWLAFLFIRLAISCRSIPEQRLQPMLPDLTLIYVLPDQFLAATKMCLDIAQWWIRPQFRVIQTLIVQADHVWFSLQVNEGLVWMTAAARLAEVMGLHLMGSDPTYMPPWDDIAFPTGPSLYKRQLCCRAWHSILFLDKIYSLDFKFASVDLPGATTPLPLNCNDRDLLRENLHYTGEPMHIVTESWPDLIRWKVVGIWTECAVKPHMSYDELQDSERRMRGFLESLPAELLAARIDQSGLSTRMIFIRSAIFSAIHSQIIKQHMPYFYRSYKQPKFQRSQSICVESANIVIRSALDCHATSTEQRHWWTYVQMFSAILVLVVDALRLSDLADSQQLVEARIKTMSSAMPLFMHAKQYARITMAKRIGHVGQLLMDAAIESARQRCAATQRGQRSQESYAEVFKRMTTSIRLNAFGSPAHTPAGQAAQGNGYSEPKLPAEPTVWTDPNASTNFLQSMGLSLDGMLDNTPSNGYSANSTSDDNSASWPASVFDELFGSDNFFTSGFGGI